jgi:predicted ATPase
MALALAHPFGLVNALILSARLHYCRREWQTAQAHAEAMLTLATEHGFARYAARGAFVRGAVLVAQGQGAEGIAQIRQGLAAWRATGAEALRPYYLALLAAALERGGQVKEGLQLLAEALVVANDTGECRWNAELHRFKGEFLLARPAAQHAEAEICFRQALDVARRRQAKSVELRAATSLSRLWQQQGKRDTARRLLEPIYGWFTEGFDTADLQQAEALLGELT